MMENNINTLKLGSNNLNFENWKVFHPNGKHMFTCGEKKAYWYLERNLAKKTNEYEIELTFIPNGNGFDDNEEFGHNIREIKCVVSGLDVDLQRHHIIPYCYRKHLLIEYKSKNHHDVVLINNKIHSKYEQIANEYKNIISEKYQIKTTKELNKEYTEAIRNFNKRNLIILRTIKSFFLAYNKISYNLKIEKLHLISNLTNIPYFVLINLNHIQLYKLYLFVLDEYNNKIYEFKKNNNKLYDHGYLVVQKLDTEEKLFEFIKLWRIHFIETMKPKYMPSGWSVDFRIKRKI